MAALIIVGLHPTSPTDGASFAAALAGLTIKAYDLTYADSADGVLLGTASGVADPHLGDPFDDSVNVAVTQIMQQYFNDIEPAPAPSTRTLQAAAVAVIVANPPAGHPEYPTAESYDLRLEITRNGQQIADQAIDFNTSVVDVTGPLPAGQPDYFAMAASAYAAIPPAPPPGTLPPPPVTLPADGTPPNFDVLVGAINLVLADDPGGTDLAHTPLLTVPQSQQIASEITWNRVAYPPPPIPRSLGEMYTSPPADPGWSSQDAQNAENDRKTFEAQLTGYYATYNAQAGRLATFVYAASAAVACEQQSLAAANAGFPFPLLTGQPAAVDTEVVLIAPPPVAPATTSSLSPAFGVPAAFFYALGATLPPTVGLDPAPGPRYTLAIYVPESKTLQELQIAIDAGVISASEWFLTVPPSAPPPPLLGIAQAARRLSSLGAVTGSLPSVVLTSPVDSLVTGWLGYPGPTAGIDEDFWAGQVAGNPAAYLNLVLQIITGGYPPLMHAITATPPWSAANPAPGLGITTVAGLAQVSDQDWTDLFLPPGTPAPPPNITLLPPFTEPGTPASRVAAFLRFLQKFFAVPVTPVTATTASPDSPATLGIPAADAFAMFAASYAAAPGGGPFTFGMTLDPGALATALAATFPGDTGAQDWLAQALAVIAALGQLTGFASGTADLQFSLMEALYAAGFTAAASVQALSPDDFLAALEGTVAGTPGIASQIQAAAGGSTATGPTAGTGFRPVNPDGSLTSCVPPEHLSPFGPVAYLSQLLRASAASTCEQPEDVDASQQIGTLLAGRRGPLGDLHATRTNLEVPLPVIDLVNESLEALATAVAAGGAAAGGAVFDTDGLAAGRGLDPADAFAAIPEHSSPAAVASPAAEATAYAALRTDFTAPLLPYDQPLDICRRYLCRMETSRFETMRRFRKEITEFVLDPAPADEPAGFERQLWRYPVRFDIALEYLGISAQEYAAVYQQGMTGEDGKGQLELWQLFGFPAPGNGTPWTDVVTGLPEFLRRTGLSYCELVELQRSGFVPFTAATVPPGRGSQPVPDSRPAPKARPRAAAAQAPPDGPPDAGNLPDCEPCCLASLRLTFPGANADGRQDPSAALYQLIVFVRLWRRLRERAWCELSFSELAGACTALGLFGGTPAVPVVNPDFLRQLAALLMLAGDLRTGPARLLALWAAAPAAPPDEAVEMLLHGVERHARSRYSCRERGPEFARIIAANMAPLSVLAGFDPDTPGDTWQAAPTHTLRFAEVLGKIYASDFTVGEILFLFTTGDHTDGDDPFPLVDADETIDDPLALPEAAPTGGDGPHSLWALRRALLRAGPAAGDCADENDSAGENDNDTDTAREWTWRRITATLREEFGYAPAGGMDPLTDLGEHFFPSVLERDGHAVSPQARQYRTGLALGDTDAQMWNAEDGPFRYDPADGGQLWTRLPLRDAAVIDRLRELRPLQPGEQAAVQELYFAARATLAPFGLIFDNFAEAAEFLVQSGGDEERFAFFQRQFGRFHARCRAVAGHLAAHVDAVLGRPGPRDENGKDHDREHRDDREHHDGHDRRDDSGAAAWRVLRSLLADGNLALGPWEDDSGQPPGVTWALPAGSALAALLGLTGTGLLGEFAPAGTDPAASPAWRETRGPLSAFGHRLDERNCPVPTVLPSLGLTLTPEQLRVAGIRNGFAFRDADGEPLGGAEPFTARWTGTLLVERPGEYRFHAGAPAEGEPDFEAAAHDRWRVTLQRGQKTWVLLSHGHPGDDAHAARSAPLTLQRGAYQLTAEFGQRAPLFDRADEACPERTGFEVKYAGPDTGSRLSAIPQHRLFRPFTGATLGFGITATGSEARFLAQQYSPDLRDIRRTYQRAFKALLLAERFGLSARPVHAYRQSELGYLLGDAQTFEGTSYYRTGPSSFGTHHAWLDLDLLPVADPYPPALVPPGPLTDQREYPSPQRQAALFDWWERIFDYRWLRAQTECAIERPPWLLFAEVAEQQPDDPAELLRHLGVDLRHAPLVLTYFAAPEYSLGPADLLDERWAVRVWHAETWLRRLAGYFTPASIGSARPDLWASDDPGAAIGAPLLSGNANLTRFVQDGYLAGAGPRRYRDLTDLNDHLRERARAALLAYLCGMNRVALPWAPGQYAQQPGDLSDLLLQDASTGICTRMSRIEDAVRAVQAFVQRARLGLEPGFAVTPAFARLWDKRFASFSGWQACARREMYAENWIEWEDLRTARRIEAFRFLEDELQRSTLTVAVPGGMSWWSGGRPPAHPSLVLSQDREPSGIQLLSPAVEGLSLLGEPKRAARLAWLAPLFVTGQGQGGAQGGGGQAQAVLPAARARRRTRKQAAAVAAVGPGATGQGGQAVAAADRMPLWLRAAAGLGTQFVRVAAAGLPPASARLVPASQDVPCCEECGSEHPPVMDEYYFWLADSRFFSDADAVQDADVGVPVGSTGNPPDETSDWDRPDKLPGLLLWPTEPMLHLYWTRVHHGEFEPPRRSAEGLPVSGPPPAGPQLALAGRTADSLRFAVSNGTVPTGYTDPTAPGFRYDLAADAAVPLPLVAPVPAPPGYYGLAAYPYFAYVSPGTPVEPLSTYSVAAAVAGTLRTHCQFEAALKWYELAYAPLTSDDTWAQCGSDGPGDGAQAGGSTQAGQDPARTGSIAASGEDLPCCPAAPVTAAVARDRAVLLAYAETLLSWGDALICRDSLEAIQQGEVIFATLARLLGPLPVTALAQDDQVPAQDDQGHGMTLAGFQPRPASLNPRLMSLYERTADRLALVRRCLDGHRLPVAARRGDRPFWGGDAVVDGWREARGRCEGEPCQGEMCHQDECLCCCGPYRFTFLLRNALDLAGEVRSLGAALLSAYEKGDGEALAALRATHERQLAELMLATREYAWREADWQVQALGMTLQGAQTRLRYYQQLIAGGLNAGETGYQALTEVSIASRTAGNISEAIAQGIGVSPDMWLGVAGFAGTPLQFNQLPVGTKLAADFSTAARIMNALAEIATSGGGLSLTEGGWDRRSQEWQLQVEVISIEIEQIQRQILAAQRHRDGALRDLNDQQQQIEHAIEVQDFLRDKFTSGELYLYLQRETAALYRQMYDLALQAGRRTQRAFNRERGHTARRFLPDPGWEDLHEALLAGERLQLALRQMESAYTDLNCREYELTKHLSLRLDFPLAFLHLQQAGWAEIEVPEWMFDVDYPGQYMRRIKNVTLTIPCVTGPYAGVHCRLTLLSSATRVDPRLAGPLACCCDVRGDRGGDCGCGCGGERDGGRRGEGCGCREECGQCGCDRDEPSGGYLARPGDPRVVREYAATQAIATSSGQNDAGLFELSFRDERYLPFELAGAVSRWRIELPPENNRFDTGTLSDFVIHLNYTAREGGEVLRRAASAEAQPNLPGAGARLLDVRHDLPEEWARLRRPDRGQRAGRGEWPGHGELAGHDWQCAWLPFRLGREHFPYLPCHRDVRITRLELFFEVDDPGCVAGHVVRFVSEHERAHAADEDCDCAGREIECVASPEWPCLFHGIVDLELPPLGTGGPRDLGEFRFPLAGRSIRRMFLVCGYQSVC